jgi:hypothetical protein
MVRNMTRTTALLTLTLSLGRLWAAEPLEWTFDKSTDIVSAPNIDPGEVARGSVSGLTRYDPYIYLRLPRIPTDVSGLHWLTVRLYSSAPADLLDVYYKSADGRWCLGGTLKVARGWAVYRMDLTRNAWRETDTGDASRQWGGPERNLISLRLDPGNEAGRWVILDYAKLSGPEPGLEEGVTVEPRGQATLTSLQVPATAQAGKPLRVAARFSCQVPEGLTTGTGYVRLRRGGSFLRVHEQPVALRTGAVALNADFGLSPYWYGGPVDVAVGVHELDLTPGSKPARVPVRLDNPGAKAADFPRVQLWKLGHDPCLMLNGQRTAPFVFTSHGGLLLDQHREMAQAGIHLYTYDYAEYDRYFAAILEVDPDAYFLPHIGLSAPVWWQDAHPDEMAQYADGRRGPPSFASELWQRDTGDDLRRLIAYLRRAPYASRVIGIAFYGGYTAEWQMWGTWAEQKDDYSQPALRAFRAFLKHRYGTDERLRVAWSSPTVTLAGAAMPTIAQRRPGGSQMLRDPRTERQSIDFYEFISRMTADAIMHFARVTREATAGKLLVGTYYGYLSAHNVNQQDSGHNAAAQVFDSPDIDFLMSPPNYYYRGPGESSTFMSATDSFRMRGKLWLDESDHRTVLSDPSSGYSRADNMPDTLGVFWREFAEVLCKRAGGSFFDMAGGWFSDPQILQVMGRARQIHQDSLAGRQPFAPEVGVFVDPKSFSWMRPTEAQLWLVLSQLVHMPEAGAPFDYCLLSDLEQTWMPDYKLYVFLNAFTLDEAERVAIVNKLKRNGATALFLYAPRYVGSEADPPESMNALLDFMPHVEPAEGKPQVTLAAASPLARNWDLSQPVGKDMSVSPTFWVADPSVTVHGRLANGQPGLVSKRNDGWTCYYSAAFDLPPTVMRNLAREAGVHLWVGSDDAVYTDGRYVGLHASADGTKTVHLPREARVRELVSGKALTVRDHAVTVDMKRGETVLLELSRP